MEEVLTTEDIARDILRTSYKLLKRYDDSIEKDDKENTYSMHHRYLKCALTFKINFSQLVSERK